MINYFNKFEVSTPIENVFNLISDVANYNAWVPSSSMVFIETSITSINRNGLGLTFVDKVRFGGKSVGEVVEFIPPERFAIKQKTFNLLPVFSAHIGYHLTCNNYKTIVTHSMTAKIHGIFKLIAPIIRHFIIKERTSLCDGVVRYFA
jgi:hypothetical protein